MTLGDLIDTLDRMPPGAPVRYDCGAAAGAFRSWRGAYEQLTLCPGSKGSVTAGDLLGRAKAAATSTFEGYKGGQFTMDRDTLVWADPWGDVGHRAPVGVALVSGEVVIATAIRKEAF